MVNVRAKVIGRCQWMAFKKKLGLAEFCPDAFALIYFSSKQYTLTFLSSSIPEWPK
jgi:hypothetical protein